VVLLLHEVGRLDARDMRWMFVHTEPGKATKWDVFLTALYTLGEVVLLILIPLGLTTAELPWYVLFHLSVIVYVHAMAGTPHLHAFLATMPHRWQRKLVVFCGCILCCFMALEFPSNPLFFAMLQSPQGIIVEFVVLTLFVLAVWLLLQRQPAGLIIPCMICLAVGIVEYYVAEFKEMPLLPSDVLALGTAAAVGFNYIYIIGGRVLVGGSFVIICCYLTRGVDWVRSRRKRHVTASIAAALFCAGLIGLGVTQIDFVDDLNITVRAWCPLKDYKAEGFIPAFISGAQSISPTTPLGYTTSGAEEIAQKYADSYVEKSDADARRTAAEQQFAEEEPCVVVIMNETFSDLSIYDNLHCDYQGPEYYNSIDDAVMQGTLYVSAYGGGTCNSEFEFLTGMSMNYFGASVYPYMTYNLEGVGSFSQHLKDLGYETTAIHPNLDTNWNRNLVYPTLGIDTFYSLDDFEDADTLRGLVTDAATYDKVLEILESSDEPQFVLDVTMQNHSSYTTGEIPEDMLTDYDPVDMGDSLNDELNEYLSCIQASDEALEGFLDELRELDRPVVVVFFGDHQPYFTGTYNDAFYPDEDDLTHTMRLWQTTYLIWANYDVAGADQLDSDADLSTNFLGAVALDAIGAPLSTYQQTQMGLHEYLQAINIIAYEGVDGTLYWDDATNGYYQQYRDLWKIQYRYFFDFYREDGIYMTSTMPGTTRPDNN